MFAAAIQILIVITFYFAAEGGVNAGIVSSIFSTSVIFSSIIFYCKYGQKLSKFDFVGIFLVIACVALISSSGATAEESQNDGQKNDFKIYAILMAILVGLTFSLNSVDLHHGMKVGFSAYQMNSDGNMFFGLMLVPFYAYEVGRNGHYESQDFLLSNLFVFCGFAGIVSLSQALKIGHAGPV